MKSLSRITVVIILTAIYTMPVRAGLLGDIWDGVKSVASSPFKAAGWLVGQGADAAVDPALDNAFGRLKDTTDHAINRLDVVSQARVAQLDEVTKKRIDQLDEVAKKRIEQVDEVLKKRLDQTDRILDKQLNHLEAIGAEILDREAKILDENVTRVEDILNRSLDRLQGIETDAFDRIDAALQDQVPYAASQIARTVEWTAAIIVFLVVLVGYGGVFLLKRIQSDSSTKPILAKLIENLAYVPRSILLVGVPMLFLFAVVQAGYYAYCNRVDAARIARLEVAANLLEQVGDYKAAINFRKRAFALNGKPERNYMVIRDQWLASFWQRHVGQDSIELLQRLSYLRTDPVLILHSKNDPEIEAAALYLRGNFGAKAVGDDETKRNKETFGNDVKEYMAKYVSKTHPPVLGKLVFMAEAKRILNDKTQKISERLDNASLIVDELLSHASYAKYAPGLVLKSQVSVHQLELERDRYKDPINEVEIAARRKDVEKVVLNAYAADPNLSRYVRFRASSLPPALKTNLQTWQSTKIDERNVLRTPQGSPLSDTINAQFKEFEVELRKTLDPLIGVDVLSRAKVERQILYAIRSSLGEEQLTKEIANARLVMAGDTGPTERFAVCNKVANTASELGKLHLAEAWYEQSAALVEQNPSAFNMDQKATIEKKLIDIQQRSGYAEEALTSGQKAPMLTDIMFYIF